MSRNEIIIRGNLSLKISGSNWETRKGFRERQWIEDFDEISRKVSNFVRNIRQTDIQDFVKPLSNNLITSCLRQIYRALVCGKFYFLNHKTSWTFLFQDKKLIRFCSWCEVSNSIRSFGCPHRPISNFISTCAGWEINWFAFINMDFCSLTDKGFKQVIKNILRQKEAIDTRWSLHLQQISMSICILIAALNEWKGMSRLCSYQQTNFNLI